MPRKPRVKSKSGIYHIMLRGINKQLIFEEVEDKRKFLDVLKRFKDTCDFQVYSYCLMDNHVHLLVKEVEESISQSIKRISSSYVYWYNQKYERCGHLFQDRFRSENVENRAYFLTVLRYIHQNPIKAGLTKSAFDYRWSSCHEYLNNAEIIDSDLVFNLFSPEKSKAIQLFREFMQEENDDQCMDEREIVKKTDSEVRELLYNFGVQNTTMLQRMEKKERDNVLATLKRMEGISVRQISRITGVSKSVINRIR
ncbi:transposase [Schinkia sp. CFF1]